MKKMILSIALIAGMFAMTNVSVANASSLPNTSIIAQQNDGYVDVQLEDLNEQVRTSINELSNEHDIKSIQYSSEKNLTKVEIVKNDDQSTKTVFFKDNGEKVEKDRDNSQQMRTQQSEGVEQNQGIQQREGTQQQGIHHQQELERQQGIERQQQQGIERQQGIEHQEGLQQEEGVERQEGTQQQGIERQELERRENLERENLERENLQRENLERENF